MAPQVPHLSDCYRPAPDVLARDLGDEVVLLDPAGGRYFDLNATGRRIWSLLAAEASLDAVLGRLEEEFEAPRPQLEADLLELVGRLASEGLVARAG